MKKSITAMPSEWLRRNARPASDDIGVRRALRHVAGDRGLGDAEAELAQFAVNARGSPVVLQSHPADQLADLTVDFRPPRFAGRSGELSPIAP